MWGKVYSVYYRIGLEIGVLVKEMYISTISMLAGVVDPIEALRSLGLTIKNGIALALIFNVYIPCVATVVAIKVELKNGLMCWKSC